MLPPNHRLPGSSIPLVLSSSHSFKTQNLSLKFIKTKKPTSRLGFIAPIKSFPKAPTRNKIKRQLRHAALDYLNQLKPDHDLIIIAQKSLLNLSFSQLKKEIKTLFTQASLFKWSRFF